MNDSPRPSLKGRIARFVARWLKVLVVCGILLHLTIRDTAPILAVLYYALPRGVLAVFAIVATGLTNGQQSRLRVLSWFAASIAIVVWWHAVEWRESAPATPDEGIRVMYWNVSRGIAGWETVIRRIEHERPDLVALGESGFPSSEFRAMWRERLPQYDISFLGGGMMCLVRGASHQSEVRQIARFSEARQIDVTIDDTDIRCLIVDVYAHPLYDRAATLSDIARVADQSSDKPLIVLGDFNTPLESVHFRHLSRNHVNAFDRSGSGYLATWPAFAPVLSLDQIWINRLLEVVECRHGRTSASDHRPVLATVRSADATPPVQPDGN